MKISDFIQTLVNCNYNEIEIIIDSSIHSFKPIENYSPIEKQIENIDETKFTDFGAKISECLKYCKKKIDACTGLKDDSYVDSIKSFLSFLQQISQIISVVGARRESMIHSTQNTSDALAHNKDVIAELNSKMGTLKKEVNAIVKDADDRIDSKIFTLLINTVAILGIFVAIAFAGFGVTSIFSNLNLEKSLLCKDFFIKTVFFLMLIALLSYNLLLLLIYFIFKLSRPILMNTSIAQNYENGEIVNISRYKFTEGVSLKPFFWVNGTLFLLTLLSFIWCLCL